MKLDFWKSIVLVGVVASVICLGIIAYGILMIHNDLENLSVGVDLGWRALDVNITDMPDLNTSVDFGYGESVDVNVMDMPQVYTSVDFGYGESLDVDATISTDLYSPIDVNSTVEFGYGESLDVDVSGSVYNW